MKRKIEKCILLMSISLISSIILFSFMSIMLGMCLTFGSSFDDDCKIFILAMIIVAGHGALNYFSLKFLTEVHENGNWKM